MERQTIDFGIDLGTTNSAVAVLRGVSNGIIKSNRDADITPSVVGIDKRGAMRVGEDARGLAISDSGNAFSEFKRQMGANFQYVFERSGITKRPRSSRLKYSRSFAETFNSERVSQSMRL